MSLFEQLDVHHDHTPWSAAMNMAIDEALLEIATAPSIRFYRWTHPALSFGYFGKFADVANHAGGRDLVRRWTGGGIVFHGDDLTYSIIIPAINAIFAESSISIYAAIHDALRDTLAASGHHAELAEDRDAAQRAVPTNACFAHPVPADVMLNGRKVAGAAQRRTRRGLLQQGSIQEVKLALNFEKRFSHKLSSNWTAKEIDKSIIERAAEIAEQKYLTQAWLYRR